MKSNPRISVITPCFNGENTIRRTLESVLSQTYPAYEYIIIDGNSTDRTLSIIEEFKKNFGSKLKIVSEKDKGIYDAMNKGIAIATGDIIGIVNCDDYYEKDCLENVSDIYDSNIDYQIIYGMMRTINSKEEELSITIKHHRNMKAEMINHPASFVSRKVYEDFGTYDDQYKSAADLDFMLRIVDNKSVTFKPIYKVLTNFTEGGISGSYIGRQEHNDILFKHGIVNKKNYKLTKTKNWIKHCMIDNHSNNSAV